MRKSDYLERDLKHAVSETKCAWTLIDRLGLALERGDLKELKLTAVDLLKTADEIEKLRKRKINNDQLRSTVERLASQGVKLEIVKKVVV
ncbi:hypothetical protein [Sutcliffiella horikoshii]|uniref:hypothetical protein n=1 Tax=Sutcliffiella horikoshii TaxID=79883 RepID=UPI003CF346D3